MGLEMDMEKKELQVSIYYRYQSILVRLYDWYDWYDCPIRSDCPTIYLVRLCGCATVRLSMSISMKVNDIDDTDTDTDS